ncbi:MAG: ribonuclease R family protein [Myxococcota bacterium]
MRVTGRVRVHARGFGFVEYETDEGTRSAFIDPPSLNAFLHGDRVEADIVRTGKNRFNAKDIEFVGRNRQTLFGRVVERDGNIYLRPDRLIANTDWPFRDSGGLSARDAVGRQAIGSIDGRRLVLLRVVTEAEAALERVRARYGIRSEFPDDLLDPLPEVDLLGEGDRRDLRDLVTVTIDAPSSMDLDDALSALAADHTGAIRLFVSIADVDAHVPLGSALDQEARRRGTSVYLAGGMTPMLPRALSEDRCSLLPGRERAALTVELRVDVEGRIRSTDIYKSVIRSDQRLSYEEVAASFNSEGHCELQPQITETLAWLRAAASRIGATRVARGGVKILRHEAYISVDDAGEPTEIRERTENHAHELVERLMVAANEAVAQWLEGRGTPAVFRVHPAPSERQISSLEQSAERLGLRPGFGTALTPKALAAFEHQYVGLPSARAMDSILTKILGPAVYQTEVDQHFGLGSSMYLHFTSPIRRYADLAVHRTVKMYLEGQRSFGAREQDLAQLSEALNDLTRRASKAETEWQRMLAARHFKDRAGERFEGRVVAVKTFGLVVYLFGTGVTGTVPSDTLPDGAEYKGNRFEWPDGRVRIGERLQVRVERADEELGRIELSTAF